MEYLSIDGGQPATTVNIARFCGTGGVAEVHLVVQPTCGGPFETQLQAVLQAYRSALDAVGVSMRTAILRRFFCSDIHNQAAALKAYSFSNPDDINDLCAVSWVGQSPPPPAKVILWAYHISDPAGDLHKSRSDIGLSLRRGNLCHHWTTGLSAPAKDGPYHQTRGIFKNYTALLREHDMSLADHTIRTWLFVRDIDANYQDMVAARREFFAEHGLTRETHFIASSGIEGSHADPVARVTMDAYAIAGVMPQQIEYLAAPDHLSPTHVYGVTFERGTAVSYRDRRHLFISGTASIDDAGNILHAGNISKQLDRTLENVEALLRPTGATLRDMASFIVYVRDGGDEALARDQMRARVSDASVALVVAPVCRPGWLIEVEGVAAVPASRPDLPAF